MNKRRFEPQLPPRPAGTEPIARIYIYTKRHRYVMDAHHFALNNILSHHAKLEAEGKVETTEMTQLNPEETYLESSEWFKEVLGVSDEHD